MKRLTLDQIRTALSAHTPAAIDPTGLRQASVMVTIVNTEERLHLLLTKRSDAVEHHKGQISFPGGMVDEGDASRKATALRELEEEIGIPASSVTILGQLDDIRIPTGFVVSPFVGYIDCLSELKASADEVADVLFIPLEKFFDPSLLRTEPHELRGTMYTLHFYDVWKEPVWGATAFIIKNLTDLISKEP